ncbi:uncharacterized protein BXZ73DRAFT_108559 [Epithele typhae]|uniref:uncharacterized protein n=1 Tax=Epithele typhae TaxID=378194 RepID=UPI00200790C3|nr:uncharacterized protein BXZ73DRAFT_108559 [Epithele typhae]KAH9910752.1 hypothetical protein BXZ73DRAFT_108559 [Epithele typhae]
MSVDLFSVFALPQVYNGDDTASNHAVYSIVASPVAAAEEVVASTGVAILAKANTPVHLHRAAGVRRSGRFIAIDAVRHQMYKTKEGEVEGPVISQAASEFQAHYGVSDEYRRSSSVLSEAPTDAMDVDPTAPSKGLAMKGEAKLTIPDSVGDCEVDKHVAGFTPDSMDVEARSRPAPAPPELLEEDQSHVFERWQQRRLRGSEQWERANLPVRRPSLPAVSALDGLPSSAIGRTGGWLVDARAITEQCDFYPVFAAAGRSVFILGPSSNEGHPPSPPAVLAAAAGSSSPLPHSPNEPSPTIRGRRSRTPPRKPHSDSSPPLLLTSNSEPIRRVIEDMRKQRMSLCQSFCARRAITGAL